jgi:DNA-binding beta-propeller fold protein YncE
MMTKSRFNSIRAGKAMVALVLLLGLGFQAPAFAKSKKKKQEEAAKVVEAPKQDTSLLIWPAPPSIGRVKYLTYFAGQKFDLTPASQQKKPKQSWMDRMAGTEPSPTGKLKQMPFQLLGPFGMAVNSTGELFVADQKVGAIFVFNTETRDANLIRNGVEATFALINGVAIDDDDRIFVTDGKLHRVLILNKKLEVRDQIKDGLIDPVGIAIDTENRFLYVVDTQQDRVFVYDADSLKPLRQLGHVGKKHEMTTPGDFAAPTGVALDKDNNIYVTDTLNFRVEIFDADGNFISQFGRHCDGPGCFAHPKGIAVDGDGHIWVADPMLDILQIFDREGQLLAFLGGHGNLLGQFSSLVGVAFDRKTNRVFTSEQFPGRVQAFRYITDAEAEQLKQEKEAQRSGAKAAREQETTPPAAPPAALPAALSANQAKTEKSDGKPQ